MYLSRLILNPRNAVVFRGLGDLYAMHQLLWQAFPDLSQEDKDRFASEQIHPLLYRVEQTGKDGLVRVLVQSIMEPNWDALNACSNLLCEAETKEYAPQFETGQWLRYRLRANPIVSKKQEGAKRGIRQGITTEMDQAAWLVRQGERVGFRLPLWEDLEGAAHPDVRITSLGVVRGQKGGSRETKAISLLCVDYDGLLQITNADTFSKALRQGIGPAKGLGFGLLSVARVLM